MSSRIAGISSTSFNETDSTVQQISIRVRRKTRAQWEAYTTKIPAGELCYATDTGELRIGAYAARLDQVDTNLQYWKDLPNVLGIGNEIKWNGLVGQLCIDDGDLDA